jgi:hypothetical protein
MLALLFALVGCTNSTVAPSPQVVIAPGTERLFVGESTTLSAAVTGATEDPDVSWLSLAPGVATVDAGGVVTGKNPGMATIAAEAGRGRALRQIRVLPNLSGYWTGAYYAIDCVSTVPGPCSPFTKQAYLASFTLTQTGETVTSAAFHSNDVHFAKAGAGTIALDGSLTIVEDTSRTRRAVTWHLRPVLGDSQHLTGTMVMVITEPDLPDYSVRVTFQIDPALAWHR